MDSKIDFGEHSPPDLGGGRHNAASFHRNRGPFEEVLHRYLPESGDVLDIGCGTGQHAAAYALAFPGIVWWPSDPNALHCKSASAWAEYVGAPNLRHCVDIDMEKDDWRLGEEGFAPDTGLAAITCMNVTQISPWEATVGLIAGSAKYLAKGGYLFIYGPFKRGGEHTHYRNAAFDRHLRSGYERWGVRDMDEITALAEDAGLELVEIAEMPTHNFTLVYRRK